MQNKSQHIADVEGPDDSALPGGQGVRQLPIATAELLRLHDIRAAVRQYEHDLRQRAGDEAKKKRSSKPEAIVLKYLDGYRDHLFGHPVIRDGDGQVIVVVERTNNPPEHFFGRSKQQLRRRLGRANLSRDLAWVKPTTIAVFYLASSRAVCCTSAMIIAIEEALKQAGRQGLLRDGGLYSKSALLDAFSGVGLDPSVAAGAFAQVRDAGTGSNIVGALFVEAVGERRGRKYRFRGIPVPGISPHRFPVVSTSGVATTPEQLAVATVPAESQDVELDIHFGDNLSLLRDLPSASFDLIYIDPPFNTGRVQARTRIRTVCDQDGGDRTGFKGKRYRTVKVGTASFADDFEDFFEFMEPRLEEAHRLLKPNGAFFLHIDYREVHYCKVLLDHIFGRDAFINEIIWAYDYGARSKRKWSTKHDNILWYVKDPKSYTFNFEEMDRIPYMAPGLVGKEKAARGKTPTDVWWHTIVPTNGKERTGYPTQKPLGVMNRIIKVHTSPGARVLDFFAGSGTTGEAAIRLGRSCTLIDNNVESMKVLVKRLAFARPRFHGWGAEEQVDSKAAQAPAGVECGGGTENRTGEAAKEPGQRSLFSS